MLHDGNVHIIEKDVYGEYHFNGNFKNASDLSVALDKLSGTKYESFLESGTQKVLQIFENVFNHKAFTGRSGTFYGYEGLGSIYWHMVSKLLLAVQESCINAVNNNEDEVVVGHLLEHFYEINEGIGVHKSPELYGAFPTDPYSHTPGGKGAQQPGMTGQVKEDILSRFGELGVFVEKGQLFFNPCLLRKEEFLQLSKRFNYVSVNGDSKSIELPENSLGFTYCQVPIIYQLAEVNAIEVEYANGKNKSFEGLSLDSNVSQTVFTRNSEVEYIRVHIHPSILK